MPKHVLIRILVAVLAWIGFFPAVAYGDTFTWSGLSNTDGDLNLFANWTTAAVNPPGSNDVIVFAATDIANTPPISPIVKTVASVRGITFDNTGTYKWTLARSGNSNDSRTISVGDAGITVNGTGTALITAFVNITTAQTWNVAANSVLSITGGGTLSSSGNFKLTKAGAGTLLIDGVSNTGFTGSIDVVGGVLVNARSTSGLGTGTLVSVFNTGTYEVRNLVGDHSLLLNNGSTFRGSGTGVGLTATGGTFNIDTASGTNVTFSTVASTDTFTVTRGFGGGAADSLITINGPGTTVLSDGTTYAGGFKVTSGNLRLSGTSNLGTTAGNGRPVELAGGTLRFAMATTAGPVVLTTGSVFTVTANSGIVIERNNTANFGAFIRTTGALAINGSTVTFRTGQFVLSGNGTPFTATLNFTSLTLTGNPVLDIANGTSTDALPANQTTVTLVANVSGATSGAGFGFTKVGSGQLVIGGAANYTGSTIVNGGSVVFGTVFPATTTNSISIASGASVILSNGAASPTYGGKFDLSGSGTISRIGGTSPVLNLQGSAIKPGDTPTTAGILSMTTNGTTAPSVNLQKDGAKFASLTIKIVGTGGVAGTDHDQLAVTGALTGLSNTNLVLDASTIGGSNLTGQTLTIVTSTTSNFTGQTFANNANLTLIGINSATVNYNVGSITVSNIVVSPVPEPATCLGFGAFGLLAVRRGLRKRKSEDVNQAV